MLITKEELEAQQEEELLMFLVTEEREILAVHPVEDHQFLLNKQAQDLVALED